MSAACAAHAPWHGSGPEGTAQASNAAPPTLLLMHNRRPTTCAAFAPGSHCLVTVLALSMAPSAGNSCDLWDLDVSPKPQRTTLWHYTDRTEVGEHTPTKKLLSYQVMRVVGAGWISSSTCTLSL